MSREPHPDVQQVLELVEQAGVPEMHELEPEQARETFAGLRAAAVDVEPVADVTDRTIPGPDGDLPVRVYDPGGDGPKPALVYFHGGGFVIGSVETHDSTCRALANAADSVVVSVDYRLAPENPFPAAVEDAYAATEWVAEEAAAVGADPDRLAVGGDSAGGTLAAVTAMLARDRGAPDVDYQLLVYPAVGANREWPSYEENGEGYFLTTADMEWFRDQYLDSPIDARNPYAYPLQACDFSGLAPATVVTAGFDPLRDEGQAYADALEDAGVPVTRRHHEDMIHGFVSLLDEPEVARARETVGALGEDLAGAL